LRFRSGETIERDDLQGELVAEGLHEGLVLAFAEQAVVDEDADELVADGLVDDERRDQRVDAAREAADDLGRSDHLPDLLDLAVDERGDRPVGLEAALAEEEVRQDLQALLRVDDLGVELDAEEPPGPVLDHRGVSVGGAPGQAEARRDALEPVAMAHPDLLLVFDLGQEPRRVEDAQGGEAVLALLRRDDLAAEEVGHELDAIADAEDRDAELEDALVRVRRALAVNALRPAREDEGRRFRLADRGDRRRIRQDLRVDAELADLPGDELGVLRPEIEDEDFLHGGILSERGRCFNLC
jgi:hypothetical protein